MKTFISNLLLAMAFFTLLLILFVYAILPIITNQGETVRVPDVSEMLPETAANLLHNKKLSYEVEDSVFEEELKANVVVSQHPQPGKKVKINREIDLVVNKEIPPKVKMPNLENKSLELARYNLNTAGLALGEISFKPFYADSLVLEQLHHGEPVQAGTMIHLTTAIDLVVGYQSEESVLMPDLQGMDIEEVENRLKQYVLILNTPDDKYGKADRQYPTANTSVNKGSLVEVIFE